MSEISKDWQIGVERDISDLQDKHATLERRHADMEGRLNKLFVNLEENTRATQKISDDTTELLAIFRASKLGAAVVRWVAGLGSAMIVGYAAYKGLR